jgi:hypothetical protein
MAEMDRFLRVAEMWREQPELAQQGGGPSSGTA